MAECIWMHVGRFPGSSWWQLSRAFCDALFVLTVVCPLKCCFTPEGSCTPRCKPRSSFSIWLAFQMHQWCIAHTQHGKSYACSACKLHNLMVLQQCRTLRLVLVLVTLAIVGALVPCLLDSTWGGAGPLQHASARGAQARPRPGRGVCTSCAGVDLEGHHSHPEWWV